MKQKLKMGIFVAITFLLLLLSVNILFISQSEQLDNEFSEMLNENLEQYAMLQNQEVVSMIEDNKTTLESVSMLIEVKGDIDFVEWLDDYLEQLNRHNSNKTEYLSKEYLKDGYKIMGDKDRQSINKSLAGESVITDVNKSFNEDGYYFGIVQPITINDEVVGVVRTLANAENLLDMKSPVSSDITIESYLIRSDGDIINVNDKANEWNIYESLSGYDVNEEAVQKLKENIGSKKSDIIYVGKLDKDMCFVSYTTLGYNDWGIVNVFTGNIMTRYKRIIMFSTVATALFLSILVIGYMYILLRIQKSRKQTMSLANSRYEILAELSNEILFEYEYAGDKFVVGEKSAKVLDIETVYVGFIKRMEENPKFVASRQVDFVKKLVSKDCVGEEFEYCFTSGRKIWISVTTKIIYDDENVPKYCVGKIIDTTEQKQREQNLLEKSERDPLTGVYNKVVAESKMAEIINYGKSEGYMFLIDIDQFKDINDTKGHRIGDIVLRRFSEILKQQFRGGDIIGRIGGDEFTVFMVGCNDKTVAQSKAEGLIKGVHSMNRDELNGLDVTVSIGIARVTSEVENYAEIYSKVDSAMYQVKSRGKNGYKIMD